MKNIAVILAGCGVFDGSEIHEATLTLLSINRRGHGYQCFAPDIDQTHVINHITGEVMEERRNTLIESARIARGAVLPLSQYSANKFDAVVIPGGFGVAKNLSTLAFSGAECEINSEFREAIESTFKAEKPIGALCITPAVIAKILPAAAVTIGQDSDTIGVINSMGAEHHETDHGEVIIDEKYKLATSPCYMLDANITQIAEGADAVVDALIELMEL